MLKIIIVNISITLYFFFTHRNQLLSLFTSSFRPRIGLIHTSLQPLDRLNLRQLWLWSLPYLLMYKSTSCISRPPIFKVKNRISDHFGGKQKKFTPIQISQNVNLFFLRMSFQVFVYDSYITRVRFLGLIFWSLKVDLYTSKYGIISIILKTICYRIQQKIHEPEAHKFGILVNETTSLIDVPFNKR